MKALLLAAALVAPALAAGALQVDAPPYKAACDGTTDDSRAIQRCVDDSAVQGTPCALPGRECVFGTGALTIPDGGGLTGNGARGVHASILRLNADGGGPCDVGRNGAIRISSGNSTKLLSGLSVRSGAAGPGCLVNVSSPKQVGGARVEDVDFYPAAESTAALGLFLGNVVTSTFERNYFAVGFAADVRDAGEFSNAVRFRDNFFDELRPDATGNFMVTLAAPAGSSFTGNVFESGPNGLRVESGQGVTISDNWMGDVHSLAGGTWMSLTGSAMLVSANFLNCESPASRPRGIAVSGRGANVIEGNWIDGALVGISAAGDANIVKGNEIFYPEAIGVQVSTGTGQEIGPNHITIGGARLPHRCDPGAKGNKIVAATDGDGSAKSGCSARNSVENWAR